MNYRDISIESAILEWRERGKKEAFFYREFWAGEDIWAEERLHFLMKQEKKNIPKEQTSILNLEYSLIEILFEMEKQWVRFDKEKALDIGKRLDRDIEKTEREIHLLAGEAFNINSPKQIQVILFEKLKIPHGKKNKTGYSVDNEVLEKISEEYSIASLILEYRSLSKLRSTYIDWLLGAIDSAWYIHTTYDSLGAATGRMSSNDPNLQNIPTGDGYAKEIKSCFIPKEWNIFLVADYSQIELRVLAFLSQDKNLLMAFKQNEDIHMRTARYLFPNRNDITSAERRIAKTVNFWVIYGITGFGLSKTLHSTPWEADGYIKSFYELYPWVREYYDALLENSRNNGFVETYFGRRRMIRGINDANKTLRSIAEREAINMPIQWTAADIIKYAMLSLSDEIKKRWLSWKMILQVHDELVFDIPPSEKEIFEKIVRENMENILEKYKKDETKIIPPILVDISFWKNWAEAKD